jgi:peptidoglycan/LPS O-acetylase OafA/YrhL
MSGFPKAQYSSTLLSEHRRVFGLEIARVCCALLIVFNHLNNYISDYSSICKFTFPIGYVAQDLLFGLSGFLIAKRLADVGSGKLPLSTFLIYRWVRTVPLFYIFLIINYLLYTFLYSNSNDRLFANTSFSLADYVLFIQNFFSRHPGFYPEIWSIAIEEWCFFLYPLFLMGISRFFTNKSQNAINILLVTGLSFIVVMSVIRGIWCYDSLLNIDWNIRKVVALRLDALAYGVVAYALVTKYPDFFKRYAIWLAIPGALAALFISFAERISPDPLFNATIFTLIPTLIALMLPFFYFHTFESFPLRWKAIISHFSLVSYSVLLIHLYFLQFLLLQFFKPASLTESILFTVAYFSLVLIVSTWVYNTIERPLINMRARASEKFLNLKAAFFR